MWQRKRRGKNQAHEKRKGRRRLSSCTLDVPLSYPCWAPASFAILSDLSQILEYRTIPSNFWDFSDVSDRMSAQSLTSVIWAVFMKRSDSHCPREFQFSEENRGLMKFSRYFLFALKYITLYMQFNCPRPIVNSFMNILKSNQSTSSDQKVVLKKISDHKTFLGNPTLRHAQH